MLWINAEENRYYQNPQEIIAYLKNNKLFSKNYDEKRVNFLFMPNADDIRNSICKKNTIIVSPLYPSDMGYADYGFFTLIEIKNEDSILTSEQIGIVDEDKVIASKLGLTVTTSNLSFKDMAGASILLEDTKQMLELEKLGIPIGGIFLFGVPGIGKSFFAECFAGETGRYLVEMDLSYVINTSNPTRTIDKIFDYLYSRQNEKFVLWIDEIEKMFDTDMGGGNLKSKQVFGKLLKELNEVSKNEFFNIVFIATANNVVHIMKQNPEFLRKGRFRKLYFLNYPKLEDSLSAIEFYYNKTRKKYLERFKKLLQRIIRREIQESDSELFKILRRLSLSSKVCGWIKSGDNNYIDEFKKAVEPFLPSIEPNELYAYIDVAYPEKAVSQRFIYTYSEIKVFVEEFFGNYIFLKDIQKAIKKTTEDMPPLQISMKDAIQSMVSQAKSYKIDSRIFIEI